MRTALGAIEVQSIPKGIEAGDAMLKAAHVELISAGTVCAGKYVVVVAGEVDAVNASVQAGAAMAGGKLIDSLLIPRIHPQVPRAINACTDVGSVQAVGTMELFSVCAAIQAADAAVKAATVDLIEVRLGRGLGGKSFVVLTGDVASVRAAVESGRTAAREKGLVSDCTVVPSPHPDLVKALL
ncbi:BMC domain-containing protein [Pseudoflavonifractor sp.]|jgi:microcompartment protein CcmL/EutN|uniref:BMC domain-containing protein n=1 Tax=Pseudoflavonifractor sp. TaxID=1980281 RepID=UPI003D90C194